MKILIVDKASETLRSMTELVVAAGHSAVTAVTGKAALSIFEKTRPDLVLLDTELSDMEPISALGTFRVLAGDDWVPVVLLHAAGSERTARAWLEAGADMLLGKPLNPLQVQACLGLAGRITQLRQQTQAVALELEELRTELRNINLRDSVTGVGNRRYFEEELLREWNRAFRNRESLTVLLVGIDRGEAGSPGQLELSDDRVQRVATALASALRRSGDVFARYDENKFGLLLPNTDAAGAELIAQRLVAAVAALGLPFADDDRQACISVSVGSADGLPGPASRQADWLSAAAEALLHAQRNGPGSLLRREVASGA